MFIVEMIIFTAFLGAAVFCTNFVSLVICLFGLGLALGCDYPTAHMIISENIPSTSRGKLVLGAFAFQAVGALGGTAVGYAVLVLVPNLERLALDVCHRGHSRPDRHHRPFLYHRERELAALARGATDRATVAASRLLKRTPQYPPNIVLSQQAAAGESHGGGSFMSLFKKRYRRATILASVPWFLQDLSTYGIGIFTPTILAAALGHHADHVRSMSDLIANEILAARGAAMITLLLIVGIVFAVLLADKLGRIRLQIIGFIGCAVGLLLASLSVDVSGGLKIILIFSGFMLFNFMTNLGPNAQTYLLAGEVFPTAIRGKGAGLRRSLCQDRRGRDRVPVSYPAGHHRHAVPALRPDRRVAAWGGGDVDVPHRDHGGQSRPDRRGSERAGSQPQGSRLTWLRKNSPSGRSGLNRMRKNPA